MLGARGAKRAPWPKDAPPVAAIAAARARRGSTIRLSFIGHSSFLIQTEGVNLLLDPVWASARGPCGPVGPRRVTPPGVALEDLPPLDAILRHAQPLRPHGFRDARRGSRAAGPARC